MALDGRVEGPESICGTVDGEIVTFGIDIPAGARVWGVVTGDPSIDDADDQFLQVMVVNTSVPGWSVGLIDVDLP